MTRHSYLICLRFYKTLFVHQYLSLRFVLFYTIQISVSAVLANEILIETAQSRDLMRRQSSGTGGDDHSKSDAAHLAICVIKFINTVIIYYVFDLLVFQVSISIPPYRAKRCFFFVVVRNHEST